jgi:hypothetical protein
VNLLLQFWCIYKLWTIIPGVSEMGTIILSGNNIRQAQPISLVTFWGKIALKRYKNHGKFSSNLLTRPWPG